MGSALVASGASARAEGTPATAVPAAEAPPPARRAAQTALVPIEDVSTLAVSPDALDPELIGQPIVRIEAELLGARWGRKVNLVSVQPGDPLSAELARRAMTELTSSGGVAGLAAEAVAEGDGVVLHLVGEASRIVDAVQITGGIFERAATLASAGLAVGDEVTEASLAALEGRLRKLYAERGFPSARVDVEPVALDAPEDVLLAITIEPGEPRLVTQRIFVIDPTEDALVGDGKLAYAVRADDRADAETLFAADRKLTEALRAAGFPSARVTHRTIDRGGDTYLYVYVESGLALRLGFEGALAFDPDRLRAIALGDGTSEGASAKDAIARRLVDAYVERGYLDVRVTVDRLASATPGVEPLRVRITEGARSEVVARTYPCLRGEVSADELDAIVDRALEEALPSTPTLSMPSTAVVDATLGGRNPASPHPEPPHLDGTRVFERAAYEGAAERVRDALRARGYLHAAVGPWRVERPVCDRASPPGACLERPVTPPGARCLRDDGLPVPETASDGAECVPDPATGRQCSTRLRAHLPVQLGPRTLAWDVVFDGNTTTPDRELVDVSRLELGVPLSRSDIEAARARLVDYYQNRGYAYVDVRAEVEPSPDHTRARIAFTIAENARVTIEGVDVEGAMRTDRELVLRRLDITPGSVYSKEVLRRAEERIAALGTFSSVSVALADPEVPLKSKRLVVRVTEYPSQYIEPRVGFSSGDGLRFGFEYGHRNIGSLAIGLTLRLQLSYLFDFLIADSAVATNLGPLPISQRLERRDSVKFTFPDIGLGPSVGLALEAIDVRDNQRDFGLTRQAIVPSLTFRPVRDVVTTFAVSAEVNDETIFNADAIAKTVRERPSLALLLLFPDGTTFAAAQRASISWDRRKPQLEARRGTFASLDVEHVNALPIGDTADADNPLVSHFVRLNGRVAGYIPITDGGASLALSLGAGVNVQLQPDSKTYPDRLLFLGGFDSIRCFLPNSVVPQDVADQIPSKLTIDDVAIRGGDLSINPRAELRLPVTDAVAFGIFLDTANLWVDPASFDPLTLRYGGGAGVRISTPVGPLALDYGVNLDRRPWEDFGALHFSVGLY